MSDDEGTVAGMDADEMDSLRLRKRAYEYLCRLNDVRQWLSECLKDEGIPPASSLENNFRNGVLLARLSNSFAPQVVPQKNIFDLDQAKYLANEETPVYRHTDNVVQWIRAMKSVNLPSIFLPEPVDVYEGRNTKTTFCLIALATLLYRLRKAPPMRNTAGHVDFTKEEVEKMEEHLQNTKLPAFNDVSNMLSENRITVDGEDVTKLVEAIQGESHEQLLEALQQYEILYVETTLVQEYHIQLKAITEVTRKSVQQCILDTNDCYALAMLSACEEDKELLHILDLLQFENSRPYAIPLYFRLLREAHEVSEVLPLPKQQVIAALNEANAMADVKVAVVRGSARDSAEVLRSNAFNVQQQNASLYHNSLKQRYTAEEGLFLVRPEIQEIISKVDGLGKNELLLLKLKEAVRDNDVNEVEQVLRELGYDVVHENVETYMQQLRQEHVDPAKVVKEVNEKVRIEAVRAEKVRQLNDAVTRKDSKAIENCLEKLELEARVRKELLQRYVEKLLAQNLKEKVAKENQLNGFKDENDEVKTRDNVSLDYQMLFWEDIEEIIHRENEQFDEHFDKNMDKVKTTQRAARQYLEQKKRKEAEKEGMDKAARTIQKNYKAYSHRKQSRVNSSATGGANLAKLRAMLEEHGANEMIQQLDVEELKTSITNTIAENRQLDISLRQLDDKIGLIVKNRIHLQDVIAHKDEIIDSMNSENRQRASANRGSLKLSQLFFHLQADPRYLANFILNSGRDIVFLADEVVSPTFGFCSEKREEFCLVQLLCELLLLDIEAKSSLANVTELPSFPFIRYILSSLFDRDDSQSLEKELKEFFIEQSQLKTFNLDPVQIYKSINDKEPKDIHEAAEDIEVMKIVDESKAFIAKWADLLSDAVCARVRLPTAVIYLARFLEEAIPKHLPSTSSTEVQKFVHEFVFEIFVRNCLLDATSPRTPHIGVDASQSLSCVSEFLAVAVCNKGYGNSKWYLTSLNAQVHLIYERFRTFVTSSIKDKPMDDLYGVNAYTQFDACNKPTLSILTAHIKQIVVTLTRYIDSIVDDQKDLMKPLLQYAVAAQAHLDTQTVILHLLPFDGSEMSAGTDELFVRTKKYIVDLLLSGCEGETLDELLTKSPNEETERNHNLLYNRENLSNIAEKQTRIRNAIQELKRLERIDESCSALLDGIASDISNTSNRQQALGEQRRSLEQTKSRLEAQRVALNQRLTHYEEYLETCLCNIARTPARSSFRPTTKEASKIQEKRLSTIGQQITVKKQVEKMFRKGILVDVTGYDNTKKLAKMSLEMTRSEHSQFTVRLIDGKKICEENDFDLQHLLMNQSAGQSHFAVGPFAFDTSKLVAFVNNKFLAK